MDAPTRRLSVNRLVAMGVGAFLILVFFGLRMTAPGLRITFHPPLNASSPGEVYFWLGHALLLFPASCLVGYALAPPLGSALSRLQASVSALGRRELTLGLKPVFEFTSRFGSASEIEFVGASPDFVLRQSHTEHDLAV